MQKTMKNREIMMFWQGLITMSGQGDQHRRFAYAIARNIGKLESIVRALEESMKPLDEFEKKRRELAQAFSKKDEQGNPVSLPNNQGVVIADMLGFNASLEEVRKSTGQDKRDEEVEEMMLAEEEVDVYTVPYSMIPEQIRPDLLKKLMPMFEDPTDEDFEENSLP